CAKTVTLSNPMEHYYVTSSGFPLHYHSIGSCVWEIHASPGQSIVASFQYFNLPERTGNCADRVIISEGLTNSTFCIVDDIISEFSSVGNK
ncbi:hypothetical protein PFISCL1PPCAC_12552, partial [Pristionchus fissidentatus]